MKEATSVNENMEGMEDVAADLQCDLALAHQFFLRFTEQLSDDMEGTDAYCAAVDMLGRAVQNAKHLRTAIEEGPPNGDAAR